MSRPTSELAAAPDRPAETAHGVVALLSTPPPVISTDDAVSVGKACFGFDALVTVLTGERDRNFLMTSPATGGRAVLKFINSQELEAETDCQIAVLEYVGRREGRVLTPRHIPSLDGEDVVALERGRVTTQVRAYTFLEGRPATQVNGSRAMRQALGRALGSFDVALSEFSHHATKRTFLWDLMHLDQLRPFADVVQDAELRTLIKRFIDVFSSSIAPSVSGLRMQVIHNDLNKSNFIIGQNDDHEIAGILDFGDMTYAPLICDLAIAASYQMQDTRDPFEALDEVVDGFETVLPLQAVEKEHLIDLVLARTVQRVVITEWRAAQFPENRAYILRHTSEARALFMQLFPAWQRRSRHACLATAVSLSR